MKVFTEQKQQRDGVLSLCCSAHRTPEDGSKFRGMSVTQVTAVSGLSSLRSPARAPEGLLCLQEQLARCSALITPVSPPHLLHGNSEPSAGFIVQKLSYSSLHNRVRSRVRPKVCNLLSALRCSSVFPFSSTKIQAWEEKVALIFL